MCARVSLCVCVDVFVCVSVAVCACACTHAVHTMSLRVAAESWLFPAVWVLGIEVNFAGVAAAALTTEPPCQFLSLLSWRGDGDVGFLSGDRTSSLGFV